MPQFVAEIHKAMPLHRRAVLLRLGTNARMIGGHAIRSCRFSISPPDGGPSILSFQEAQRESILHALTPNGAVDFLLEFGFRYAGCVCNGLAREDGELPSPGRAFMAFLRANK